MVQLNVSRKTASPIARPTSANCGGTVWDFIKYSGNIL